MDQPTGIAGYDPAVLATSSVVIAGHDVPYPPMPAPPYRTVENRSWQIRAIMLPACPGYFSGPQQLSWTTFVLARDGITWMSLVPMEVESQMPHLAAASGTVVICGLGLGLMAYAVAARLAVSRVIVVERDPEVIAMFREFTDFERWPHRDKVEVVLSDARDFRFDGADFLYVDIWPFYRMDAMIDDMRVIHGNVPAPRCGYWGQELDMVDFARERGTLAENFTAEHVQAFARTQGLPLIGLEQPEYPLLCRRAASNPAIRSQRVPLAAATITVATTHP